MGVILITLMAVTFIGALLVIGKAGEKENICNYGQVGEDSDLDR